MVSDTLITFLPGGLWGLSCCRGGGQNGMWGGPSISLCMLFEAAFFFLFPSFFFFIFFIFGDV